MEVNGDWNCGLLILYLKSVFVHFTGKTKSFRFGTTWVSVNIFFFFLFFEWAVPLIVLACMHRHAYSCRLACYAWFMVFKFPLSYYYIFKCFWGKRTHSLMFKNRFIKNKACLEDKQLLVVRHRKYNFTPPTCLKNSLCFLWVNA